MFIRFLFIASFLFFGLFAFAQQGNYFLTHYTPSEERIDYVTYAMAQDQKGIIYFANKSGVLEFDGRNWSLIITPGPVYTITTLGAEVFVAGFNGFGKLVMGNNNMRTYQSLSDNVKSATQIFASIANNGQVYFLSEQIVFVYSIATSKVVEVKVDSTQGAFTGIYEILGKICINSELAGLLQLENGSLVNAGINIPTNQPIVFSSLLAGTKRVVTGSEAGSLFILDEKGAKEINIRDKSFLERNVVVGGTWINENLIAVGTLRGGVIFIHPDTGATEEITNFYTGLPDNEVYSLLCDRNQGLWVAHDYGFTRVAPNLPFRSYSHYPGLEGNLLCASNFKGQIYVGTTLGLFALVREEMYEDAPPVLNKTVTSQDQSKSKRGVFSFLKKSKSRAITEVTTQPQIKGSRKVAGTKVQTAIKAIRYVYRRVGATNGKVSQLIEGNGKLLAAGVSGVMDVDGLKSTLIMHEPVRSIFVSPSLRQLIASTFDEEVKTFLPDSKGWKETHLLDTLHDYVSYIFEDKLENIWLCSRTSVYKVETVDHEISDIESIPFSNPIIDETTGLAYGSEVYVAASGTFNRFDIGKNGFEKYDSLPGPKKYFASAGYFWFFDGHNWRTVDPRMQASLKLEWLGLFHNIRFIAPVGMGEGLWVITAANELYKFSSSKVMTEIVSYPLFLREVRAPQSKLYPARSVKVSQLESTVTFDFIQPDYLGMNAIEYRYLVRGLNKDWSVWSSNNNVVNFSYLPTGNYKIEVQTRDLMGKVSNVEQIELEIEPPYWQQSWFYASEFIFFTLLVFISIRMSGTTGKYRFISRLLSLLTVIMLIQFIQTVVASQITFKSTPVIEFFIQVSIALLVLPIEGYLRKVMRQQPEPGKVQLTEEMK